MLHGDLTRSRAKTRRPVGDDAIAYQEMVVVQLGSGCGNGQKWREDVFQKC